MKVKLIILKLSLFIIFGFVGFLAYTGNAAAHVNTPWNGGNYSSWCNPPRTSGNTVFYVWANTLSPQLVITQGNNTSVTIVADSYVCYNAPYNPPYAYNVITHMSNTGGVPVGTVNHGTINKGNLSRISQTVSLNTSGLAPGNHQKCFQWRGQGTYGSGKGAVTDYTGDNPNLWYNFCVDIRVESNKGDLWIIKYPQGGASHSNLDGCRMFIFAKLECTGDASSRKIIVNAGSNYAVAGFPDAGYKVTKIRVNRYSPGCSPCSSEHSGSYLDNISVTAGGTTYVDIFFEPEKGTFSVVKYPERGASNANLTADGRNSSNSNLFTVGPVESTDSKVVNVGNDYKVALNPAPGFKVTRVRINRSNGTQQCNFCGFSGNEVTGVRIIDGVTTWVDVFYEPDIDSNLSWVCPKPGSNGTPAEWNGKVRGWVKDAINNGGASRIDIYIDGVPGNVPESGYSGRFDANLARTGPPGPTGNYGFEVDIPSKFFDGNNHTIRVYVLRKNAAGFWGGFGDPTYQINNSPKEFSCPPPIGAARCFTDQSTKISYFIGWGLDPRRPGQRQSFKFYYDGSATFVPVAANEVRNDKIGDFKNSGYPGVVDNSDYYGFKIPVPDKYHDGQNHTLRIYLSTLTQPDKELNYVDPAENPLVFGPNKCGSGGSVDPWFWPWIQTQNGDVIASGKITGQLPDLPGSRSGSVADKEAEYLIISALMNGNGGPFCSTYQYILTNTSATGQGANCSNGSGYDILNRFSLGSSPADDAVIKSIETSYNTNGAGNSVGGVNTRCTPYNTFSTLPSQNIDTVTSSVPANNCINGTIFKLPAGSLGGFKILAGRMTIFIDGNVTINDNISYQYVGYSDPRAMPNLAIIVRGDVNIGPGVTQLDAAVYATGRINTCSSYNPANSNSTVTCNNRLSVNGMLVGKDGFTFGRSFYNQASRLAAEFISLTGQTVAFPPPGLDSTNFENFDNSVQIDSGEFQPRF